MAVSVGDTIPDIEVEVLDDEGNPRSVRTGDVLGSGNVVLFARAARPCSIGSSPRRLPPFTLLSGSGAGSVGAGCSPRRVGL